MFLKDSLFLECSRRGINPDPLKPHTNSYLLSLLAEDARRKTPDTGYGMTMRASIPSASLCFPFRDLTDKEKREVFSSDEWIIEPKYYGSRSFFTYHPQEGFRVFGRNLSETTFLPEEYTENFVFRGEKRFGHDWAGEFNTSFVMDGEIVSGNGLLKRDDKTPVLSEITPVDYLLSMDRESSVAAQEEISLQFIPFDVLYLGDDPIWPSPLRTRKDLLGQMMRNNILGRKLPFFEAPYTNRNKFEFFRRRVIEGWEGCVLKSLNQPYPISNFRNRKTMVRVKPRSDAVVDDVDMFISEINSEKRLLGLSVLVRNSVGLLEEVLLGYVGIPKKLSHCLCFDAHSFFSKRLESPLLLGKVVTASIRRKNHKGLGKYVLDVDWDRGLRRDKTSWECVEDEGFIEKRWERAVHKKIEKKLDFCPQMPV